MRFFLLLCLILICGQSALQAADSRIYSVGIVPQFEVKRLHQIWRPILDALERRTGLQLQLIGSPTISAFEQEFSQGRFDFAYMNPYHIMLAQQRAGYIPLVRDVERLYGVVVTRKEDAIEQMSDLAGKTVAFPDPNALGATLLTRRAFEDQFHIQIEPLYVKTHDSVYLNVALGRMAAGGGVQKTLDRQSQEIRSLLNVIYKTEAVAPHPLAVHPRVPADVAEAVKQAMLALGSTPEGEALLAAVPISQIGPASIDDYRPLAGMNLQRFYHGQP